MLQHRGLPGTHDVELALTIFSKLRRGDHALIPRYDKSAYNGHGDRMDRSCWTEVNKEGERKVEIVVIEGWCVGFKPLSAVELESKWRKAASLSKTQKYEGKLGHLELDNIQIINENLHSYQKLTK